jgi:hypothetical protein
MFKSYAQVVMGLWESCASFMGSFVARCINPTFIQKLPTRINTILHIGNSIFYRSIFTLYPSSTGPINTTTNNIILLLNKA